MRAELSLNLTDAQELAAAARAYGESHGPALSISIVDESTYVHHVTRIDGAPYLSAEGAIAKARTSAEGDTPLPSTRSRSTSDATGC